MRKVASIKTTVKVPKLIYTISTLVLYIQALAMQLFSTEKQLKAVWDVGMWDLET